MEDTAERDRHWGSLHLCMYEKHGKVEKSTQKKEWKCQEKYKKKRAENQKSGKVGGFNKKSNQRKEDKK